MSESESTVASPCLGMCDVFEGICMGCFRDIHEISDWHDMSDEKRLQVLVILEERRADFKVQQEN